MLFCTKKFSNYPFAHRVHTHEGHCSLIHGHSWDFEISFTAEKLDRNGYLIDLGKLGEIKKFLESRFDHTIVLNAEDPLASFFQHMKIQILENAMRLVIVPSCSTEGLAQYVYDSVTFILKKSFPGVSISSVTVREGPSNSATYIP